MIKRFVKMQFQPQRTDEFIKVFTDNWQHIKAFEGCSHVELLRDTSDPCTFFTFSIWRSDADIENYRNSDLFKRVWGTVKPMFSDRPQAWSVSDVLV
jgi:quinol monooxygenase YgiN